MTVQPYRILLAVLLIPLALTCQVTSNILQRVLLIKYHDSFGTGFTLEVDDRHYLVTARHVVDGIKATDQIQIYDNKTWKSVPVRFIDCGKDSDGKNIDIAVLAPDRQLTPIHPVRVGGDLLLGQDVFFLGFPYGLHMDAANVNGTYPLPFVKRALVSAFAFDSGRDLMFLDGINNQGFSGGPVVHDNLNKAGPMITGVISGFQSFDAVTVRVAGKESVLPINSGIIVATRIGRVLSALKANPIGFKVR